MASGDRSCHDGCVALGDTASFHGFDLRCRNVDHNIARALIVAGELAQALKVGMQLAEANIGRDIHCSERILPHDAIGRKTMTGLETLHCGIDIRVERIR